MTRKQSGPWRLHCPHDSRRAPAILQPLWRIQHLYRIKTKEAELTQLKLNPIQRQLARYIPYWNQHLSIKARQEGLSTFCEVWHLDTTMFSPNTNTCMLADSRDNLQGLFEIIRLVYETCSP